MPVWLQVLLPILTLALGMIGTWVVVRKDRRESEAHALDLPQKVVALSKSAVQFAEDELARERDLAAKLSAELQAYQTRANLVFDKQLVTYLENPVAHLGLICMAMREILLEHQRAVESALEHHQKQTTQRREDLLHGLRDAIAPFIASVDEYELHIDRYRMHVCMLESVSLFPGNYSAQCQVAGKIVDPWEAIDRWLDQLPTLRRYGLTRQAVEEICSTPPDVPQLPARC